MINRTNDRLFKSLFGDEKHKARVINLINAFFEFEGLKLIRDIKFDNREIMPDYSDGKLSILDILGITEDGSKINIELQALHHKSLSNRILHYWAKLYTKDLQRGQSYSELNRTVSINLLNFQLFSYPDFHSMFALFNSKNHHRLTEQLEIHFLEITKWKPKNIKEMRRLDMWGAYFSNRLSDKEMEEIAMSEPIIGDVIKAEQAFMQDPDFLREYNAREEEYTRYITDMQITREEGIKKGVDTVAHKLLKMGAELDFIAEATGLKVDYLRKLKKALSE